MCYLYIGSGGGLSLAVVRKEGDLGEVDSAFKGPLE